LVHLTEPPDFSHSKWWPHRWATLLQQQILIVTAASTLHLLSMTHVWHLGGGPLMSSSSSDMSMPGSAVAVLTVYALARVGGKDCVQRCRRVLPVAFGDNLHEPVFRVLPAEIVYLVHETGHACVA